MSGPASLAELAARVAGYDPNDLPLARAAEVIERLVSPVAEIEPVPMRQALGRVLASDLLSPIDVPAHDNSAMDGYALRSAELAADGSGRFLVAGKAFAGQPFGGAVEPGQALRIMTGAVMPAVLDTVLPQELATLAGDGSVCVPPGVLRAGDNRRARGEDLRSGAVALAAGRVLKPADIGLAASLGLDELLVRRRIRVAFFSSGDELRTPGQPLDEGSIYDSNRHTIHAMLTRLGVVEPIDLGMVPDRPAELAAALDEGAATADAVITSGGVSVGEADHTRQVLAERGDVLFWRIAMRPGRPMALGRLAGADGGAVLFGLPGNPVAVMVTFYALVRGALLRMAGASHAPLPALRARSLQAIRKKPGRTEYQRGMLARGADGMPEVRLTGDQGSGILRSMSLADALVVLGHEQGPVQAGDLVDVLPFDGLV